MQYVYDHIQIIYYMIVFFLLNAVWHLVACFCFCFFIIILQEPDKPYNILICGLPNTGKSALINALRRKYMRKGVCGTLY